MRSPLVDVHKVGKPSLRWINRTTKWECLLLLIDLKYSLQTAETKLIDDKSPFLRIIPIILASWKSVPVFHMLITESIQSLVGS